MCSSIAFFDLDGEFLHEADNVGKLLDMGLVVMGHEAWKEEFTPFEEMRMYCLCSANIPLIAKINGFRLAYDGVDWNFHPDQPKTKLSRFDIDDNGNAFFNPSQFANRTTKLIVDQVEIEKGLPRLDGPMAVLRDGTEFYFDEQWKLVARITGDGTVDKIKATPAISES